MTHDEKIKLAIDTVTGVTATATAPFWFQALQYGVGTFMLIGGAILLVFRLMITYRDWKRGRDKG